MLNKIELYLLDLQKSICTKLESEEINNYKFKEDNWNNDTIIGKSKVLKGEIFEQAGVNFSKVTGKSLPDGATKRYPNLKGMPFNAVGVSLVIHPKNPFVPTSHANVRFFSAIDKNGKHIWWFGGGYDLTPYYPFEEDCVHWHKTAHEACVRFGEEVYPNYKKWCDEYFYLKHRKEARGVGGLFFDDLNQWPMEKCFDFMQSVGNSFTNAYIPIVQKRKKLEYTQQQRDFQLYRRGRYVEFNLLYDRGTSFGLASNGRTESILMSLPPLVRYEYNWKPGKNTKENELYEKYLPAKDWLELSIA